MPNLLELSTELILEVLQYCKRGDLASLSLTCRHLHVLAEPSLYREIHWDWPLGEPTRLVLYSRTTLLRPELAAYTKRANIYRIPYQKNRPLVDRPPTNCSLFPPSGVEVRGGSRGEWLPYTGEIVYVDDFIIHLLLRLHNLEVLELGYELIRKSKHVGDLFRLLASEAVADGSCRLSKLKEVRYLVSLEYNCLGREQTNPPQISLASTISLFYITSLKTLDIVVPYPRSFTWPLGKPCLPELTVLRLRYSQLSVRWLRVFLEATPQLKTLQYDCVDQVWNRESQGRDWRVLASALSLVASSLKDLSISLDYQYRAPLSNLDLFSGVLERAGNIGSLTSYTCLERLEIPLPVLLGWDPERASSLREVLPANLRELSLRDDLINSGCYKWTPWTYPEDGGAVGPTAFTDTCCVDPVLHELRAYLDDRETHVPSLQSVCLMHRKNRAWPSDPLAQFAELCCKAGVVGKTVIRCGDAGDDAADYGLVEETTVYDPAHPKAPPHTQFISGQPLRVFRSP